MSEQREPQVTPVRKRGRPSKYTQKLAGKICRRMAEGESLRSICRDDGMPTEGAVRGWALDDVDGFSSRYARARQLQCWSLLDRAREIANSDGGEYEDENGNIRVDPGRVSRDKLAAEFAKWEASKILREYRDKLDVDANVSVSINDALDELDADE